MSRSGYRGNVSPQQRANAQKQGQAISEFFALPGKNRPATTTQPSLRNAVHNVKSIPGDFAKLGSKIGGGFKNAIQNIKNPAPTRGGFRGGRGGARNRALQQRMK